MKISIVIPAYNEEKHIVPCLGSIQKEIRRSGVDAEIVVANNASTDRTGEIARSLGAIVVDEPRKGITFARAAGYAASTGELVANVDADTLMPEGWLTIVSREFEKKPHLMALTGPHIYYDLPWWERMLVKAFYFFGYVINLVNGLFGNASMLQGGNFVLRREALEKIGGFDTSIEFYGEDTDIGRRVSKIGKVLWTWRLTMRTSGRRLAHEGFVKTAWKYALNYFWITFLKKPHTQEYTDVRL